MDWKRKKELEGKEVKLKSLENLGDRPMVGIARGMRKNFGRKVTIQKFRTNDIFGIEGDPFGYHIDWIDDFHPVNLPKELFEI